MGLAPPRAVRRRDPAGQRWAARTPHRPRNRADAYHQKGDLDKAIRDLDAAIEVEAEPADASNVERSTMWIARGDVGRGIADLSEVIRLDPKDDLGLLRPEQRLRRKR